MLIDQLKWFRGFANARSSDIVHRAFPASPNRGTLRPRANVKPKLIAVDLDGTLLAATGSPHPIDARALRAAALAGVHTAIITGRLYAGTRHAAEVCNIRGPVGVVDGSQVVSTVDHRTVLQFAIVGADAIKLRDALVRNGPSAFVFARDAVIHDEGGGPFLRYVTSWSSELRVTPSMAEDPVWVQPDGITAVVSIGRADQVAQAAREILAAIGPTVQVAVFPLRRLDGHWGMIVRSTIGTKGMALKFLAQHYGCTVDECVVVGDWLNDIPMFTVAGYAFAMGQAPDEVRNMATDILPENSATGGGIARIVRELFGITGF